MNLKNQSGMNGTSCPSAGAKLNKIVGEVHNLIRTQTDFIRARFADKEDVP